MIIDVEKILWDGRDAFLIKGWHSDEDCRDAVRAFYPGEETGRLSGNIRVRRWPGQWNVHFAIWSEGRSKRGTFKARLLT